MAFGKYRTLDHRRSISKYCSTAPLIRSLALFFVCVWIMTSSYVNEQMPLTKDIIVWQFEAIGELLLNLDQSEVLNEATDEKRGHIWKICHVSAGSDYIPCLDNLEAIRKLRSNARYQFLERHCPDTPPTCLVNVPPRYRPPIQWPRSREMIWFDNARYPKLDNVVGEYLTFPDRGTQFSHGDGILHYIDSIQESVPDIAWGRHSRVVLDVGCGAASFGGYLFERGTLTLSFDPKDEFKPEVKFALERGIPAISAVMGTKRLPFPAGVFDVVHCARWMPWYLDDGNYLIELNRILRPGGFFIWSAAPVSRKWSDDIFIWDFVEELTKSMCWELVSISNDTVNGVGVAIYKKPTSNEYHEKRSENEPPFCQEYDDPNAAWSVPLKTCLHNVSTDVSERGSRWPEQWPKRLEDPPYWLLSSQVGVYGKPAPEDFISDYEYWKQAVTNLYMKRIGISWSSIRNVMDMRSVYGGFAAALKDMNLWVMNVVPVEFPDTLPLIYEWGLIGIYHDWCESFNTYPRSYDLLHADDLFSKINKRCNLVAMFAEVDRILRPEGKLIIRDNAETIFEVENMARSMHWEIRFLYSNGKDGLICMQKTMWRPKDYEVIEYALSDQDIYYRQLLGRW